MEKQIVLIDRKGTKHRFHVRYKNDAELRAKVDKLRRRVDDSDLFENVAEAWDDYHAASVAYNTNECYKAPLKQIKEYFAGVYIQDVKPLDVDRFIRRQFAAYNYSRHTLQIRLNVLNMIFNYAILVGYVETSPCAAVEVPRKAAQRKRDIPAPAEIEAVKSHSTEKDGLFAFFLLYTGCRRGEALAMRYEDIDRQNKVIHITKTVIWKDGAATIQPHTKTSAGMRVVPLLEPLERVLPDLTSGQIFTNKDGELYRSMQFQYFWRKYCERVGISITPHQLRHAYATILYDAGLPVKDSQALLGHASAEVTQDIYQHITEAKRARTFAALHDFVSGDASA